MIPRVVALLGNCHRTLKCRKPLQIRKKPKSPVWKPIQASPTTLSEQLRKARVVLGITQKEVAKKLGVGQSTVKFWEQGRCQPHTALRSQVETFLAGASLQWRENQKS